MPGSRSTPTNGQPWIPHILFWDEMEPSFGTTKTEVAIHIYIYYDFICIIGVIIYHYRSVVGVCVF